MDNKSLILDIAMNLNRIGNWAADDYSIKKKRIYVFLNQTTDYIKSLDQSKLPNLMKRTVTKFLYEYSQLKKAGEEGPQDTLAWAERMMTWGNILTHRSQLIKS